jgi:hypothetical protein
VIFTKLFWLETAERALKTAAQFVIGAWGLGDGIYNLFEMNFALAGGAAAGGFVLSVLTSVASSPIGRTESPSLVTGENI